MKRTLSVFIFITLFISMFYVSVSASDNSTVTYKGTPVIDGTEDDIWSTAASIDVKFFEEASAPNNPKAATATVKTLWDENFMYLYIVITDPVIDISSAGNWYEKDCIGIALDYNNVKAPPESLYDNNDAAGLVDFGLDDSITGNKYFADNTSGVTRKVIETGEGWIVEAAIPHCKAVSEGMSVGFEAQYNDARDGTRQGITNWSAGGADLWRWTDVLGTTVLTAPVAVTEEVPVVVTEETSAESTAAAAEPVTETVNPATGDFAILTLAVIMSVSFMLIIKKKANR